MSSSVRNSRPGTPSGSAAQPVSRPSTPSTTILPGETIDKSVKKSEGLDKMLREHFKGAECVFGTNDFDYHFVRIYSPAGDVLVYDMYATQKDAMTGAEIALAVIAELRKPKGARNSELLKHVKSNFYSSLLVDVDRLAPGAIVTRTVKDDDHQNIQITLPNDSKSAGKPVVLTAGPKDYLNVIKDARKALDKHLGLSATS